MSATHNPEIRRGLESKTPGKRRRSAHLSFHPAAYTHRDALSAPLRAPNRRAMVPVQTHAVCAHGPGSRSHSIEQRKARMVRGLRRGKG